MSEKLYINREHYFKGGALSLPEIRCGECNRLLMKGSVQLGILEVLCKCKHINIIGATSKQYIRQSV